MQENVTHNNTADQIICGISDGYQSAVVADHMPYDVIMANILPLPLIAMADDAAKALAEGGKIILSGLNVKHAEDVIAAHEAAGLSHVESLPIGDWMAVLMEKPRKSSGEGNHG
jgi:ribosomal protein L11 methyltransferase